MFRLRTLTVAAFLLPTFASPSLAAPRAQDEGKEAKEPPKDKDAKKNEKKSDIKPYDDVIPSRAITKKGVFLVHRVDDRLFYEIPRDKFGTEFLWVTQLAKTQSGFGLGGTSIGDRVVRFEMRDEKVLLRDVKYSMRADIEDPIRDAVANNGVEPILRSFPIKAWGKDQAAVIDVTDVFMTDSSEFGASKALNAQGMDKERSFIEEVKAFPKNIETKILATFRTGERRANPFDLGGGGGRVDPTLSSVTALIHHSMIELPAVPMKPRELDSRVGYFSVGFDDYGSQEHGVKPREYATRWRLDKKDPTAEVSEVVNPITFYISREVPAKWRPYIKSGVEMWAPVFEKAGLKNAIRCLEAPSLREDPDWDAEDARYSTLRWLPSTIENAMGPHVADPRSGEILESDILLFHNVLKLAQSWYFVQCAPLDPRCAKLPLPDELVGELLAYIVGHEVGHTLGLRHNMKGSSAYTVEQLRSKEFTEKYGTEASIMDYGRFNYVAQPGDGARLIPLIGPYDFFAIEWGYKHFPNAKTPAEEKKLLDEICARQNTDPLVRFGDPNPSEDPSQQTEDLGSDSIKATENGIANLKRVVDTLVQATCNEGEDYERLKDMYSEVLGQLDRELGHVGNVVGGMRGRDLRYGTGEKIYEPASDEEQRRAVAFLIANLFETPAWLMDPKILDRIEVGGAATRLLSSQTRLLNQLLGRSRLARLAESVQRGGNKYGPADLMLDLRQGVFRELSEKNVAISLYRRNLQRGYVDLLIARAATEDAGNDDAALARFELAAIRAMARDALQNVKDDRTVLAHLNDLVADIDQALEPKRT